MFGWVSRGHVFPEADAYTGLKLTSAADDVVAAMNRSPSCARPVDDVYRVVTNPEIHPFHCMTHIEMKNVNPWWQMIKWREFRSAHCPNPAGYHAPCDGTPVPGQIQEYRCLFGKGLII